MSITLQHQGKQRKAAILGRLDSPAEQQKLLALLRAAPAGEETPLELDFYDADTLPAPLLEALDAALGRGVRLKPVAYRALLGHCLARLGLPVRQLGMAPPQAARPRCTALALAGSAQSLDKILYIVERLPVTEVTIFVAQHVQEGQVNLLDRLLKVRTEYRVLMPQHLMPASPGTIYVAPPGHHLRVAQGLVYLTRDRKIQFARPSIDVLFESVAGEYGAAALAVLLCGFGRDGVAGCAAIRAAGGWAIVEEGAECAEAAVLPEAARQAGVCDQPLKYPAIAAEVATAITGPAAQPHGDLLEGFIAALRAQYGYDFSGYQRDSLERRIRYLMGQFGLGGFGEFQHALLDTPALFQRLLAEISVGVTAFFRHPEQLKALREEVLPYLASFPLIKVWSAGCATGEEAYTLAMLLDEAGLLEKSRIFATDLNPYLLELGRAGLYPLEGLAQSRENYRAAGGGLRFDDHLTLGGRFFKVRERLQGRILFHQHSLAQDGVFNEFQLILCRNVMIYFDHELQRRVLGRFAQSLHRDGFLALGPQDGMHHLAVGEGFVPAPGVPHLYRLRGEAGHG